MSLIKTKKVGGNLLVFGSDQKVFPERVELDFNDISDTFLTLAAVSPLLPFELKIKAPSRQSANEAIHKWKTNAPSIYEMIYEKLINID